MAKYELITANSSNITFKSAALNAITEEINGYIGNAINVTKSAEVKAAMAVGRVAAMELYTEDGFESAAQYAMAAFGWGKTYAYDMINVGIRLNDNELPDGYSISQYRMMLPLPTDKLNAAIEEGAISADMSKREIEAEVNSRKKKRAAPKAKPEKVYEWYLDNVPGRADVKRTESAMLNDNTCKVCTKVKLTIGEGEEKEVVNGILVMNKSGIIRFYARGPVAPVADTTAENADTDEEKAGE